MKKIVFGITFLLFQIQICSYSQSVKSYNFPNNDSNVHCFDLNDNVLVYSNGKYITLYDLKEETVLKSIGLPKELQILAIKEDVDGDLVFLGTKSGSLMAVSKSSGVVEFQFDYKSVSITQIAINSTHTRLFVGLSNGMVYTHNLKNINDNSVFYQHDRQITSIKIFPENHLVAISSADGTVSIHDDLTLDFIATLTVGKQWIRSVAFNKKKGYLDCVGDDGRLNQYNINNINKIWKINTSKESGDWLLTVDVHKDGSAYCIGGVNGLLKIKHQFGVLTKKFKGPIVQAGFWNNGNTFIKIIVCVLGKGLSIEDSRNMKYKGN